MTRYTATSEGNIPYTAEEEAAADAVEAAWRANPPVELDSIQPTKEQLLAQLNALSAQIQALE